MAAPVAEHPVGLAHGALAEGHAHFSTTLSYDEAENVDGRQVDVTIEFGKVVSLAAVQAAMITVTVVKDDFVIKDLPVWTRVVNVVRLFAAPRSNTTLILFRVWSGCAEGHRSLYCGWSIRW